VGNLLERLGVGDVKDQGAAVRSSVVGVAQALKPLLPSSVPDLGDDWLSLVDVGDGHFFVQEVSCYGGFELGVEAVMDEPLGQGGLAHA